MVLGSVSPLSVNDPALFASGCLAGRVATSGVDVDGGEPTVALGFHSAQTFYDFYSCGVVPMDVEDLRILKTAGKRVHSAPARGAENRLSIVKIPRLRGSSEVLSFTAATWESSVQMEGNRSTNRNSEKSCTLFKFPISQPYLQLHIAY